MCTLLCTMMVAKVTAANIVTGSQLRLADGFLVSSTTRDPSRIKLVAISGCRYFCIEALRPDRPTVPRLNVDSNEATIGIVQQGDAAKAITKGDAVETIRMELRVHDNREVAWCRTCC